MSSQTTSLLNSFEAARWDLPEVAGATVGSRRKDAMPTVERLEQIERAAFEEAYAKGLAAGQAAAKVEAQQRLDQLTKQLTQADALLQTLARPLSQLDGEVEKQLVALSVTLARQIVRRELKLDPGQIVAVIRETVNLLPVAARDVRVHLHPDDAALVRERLATPQAERAWTIIEDPVLSRGGCRVTTDHAQIDARLESRLGAMMTSLFGDDRAQTPERG
jgi:flagellar assembly protein FliH